MLEIKFDLINEAANAYYLNYHMQNLLCRT
jgi:hypothetical protein